MDMNILFNNINLPIKIGYLGPGAALSSLGAFLALIAGIIIGVFGFIWYPIRRLIRKMRNKKKNEESTDE